MATTTLAPGAGTITTVTSSASPSAAGQLVKLVATLVGPGSTGRGDVSFFSGSTLLGTAPLTQGKATFSTSTLAAGDHSITARAAGQDSSSTAITQTVSAASRASETPAAGTGAGSSTPRASGTLARTGTESLTVFAVALALLVAGSAFWAAGRRRSSGAKHESLRP